MHIFAKTHPGLGCRTSRRSWGTVHIGLTSAATAAVLLAGGLAQPTLAAGNDETRVAWGYYYPNGNGGCENGCFSNKGVAGISHIGTGLYEIEASNFYVPGPSDLQISSQGFAGPANCVTSGWSFSDDYYLEAYVNCYDLSGNPADASFSFLYQSRDEPFGSADKGIAFLLADQPTEASYTPNLDYQYNSTSATNTMVRNGAGSYTASIPGLTKKGGNVQVTAYGNGPARCATSGWSASQTGTSVNIFCFDSTGAAADEKFTLAYTIGEPLGLFSGRRLGDSGAYAWANKAQRREKYAPPRAYNYDGFKTGSLSVKRAQTGVYSVSIPGNLNGPYAPAELVTADGASNDFCSTGDISEFWNPFWVYCYDQNGNPADSKFSVLLQTEQITK
ncbi:MAG TPA: hypothetical protein VHY79_08580 [Rhizomicrobium sp.]|nr:hypothetical protein [Rhizomicrobium sp.]